MISRRGFLAGLTALPILGLLRPFSFGLEFPEPLPAAMASSYFDLNDSSTVAAWERELVAQSSRRSPLFESGAFAFQGDGSSMIQVRGW